MKDVTVIITAFLRRQQIIQCVESIRKFYPKINIIVSDNGRSTPDFHDIVKNKLGCYHLQLPFDSGASFAKNEGLDNTTTKYAVIIDDDFLFTEDTKLESMKAILDNDPSVGVVGGCPMAPGGKIGTVGSKFEVNREKGYFIRTPILNPEWHNIKDIKYYYADYTRQFLMIRAVPELRWENRMKIGGLHVYFFLNIKWGGKWKVAYAPDITIIHNRVIPNKEYREYRLRRESRIIFFEITGLRWGLFNKHTVINYEIAERYRYDRFFFVQKQTIEGYTP